MLKNKDENIEKLKQMFQDNMLSWAEKKLIDVRRRQRIKRFYEIDSKVNSKNKEARNLTYQVKNMYIDSNIQHDIKYFVFKAAQEKFDMMKIFKGLDKVEDLRIQRNNCRNHHENEGDENNKSHKGHVHFDEEKEKQYQVAKQ